MSLSAQYDSQVTPDTGVCKNPYRQRSPKRTYLPITGLYMFTYLKARQSFFHVRLLFQPVSRWPVRIFVAAWPYAATKEQGLEHSNVGLELVHTNTHTHTHTHTPIAQSRSTFCLYTSPNYTNMARERGASAAAEAAALKAAMRERQMAASLVAGLEAKLAPGG